MRYKLKSLDPMSIGKVMGAIYGGLALIIVPLMVLAMAAGALAGNNSISGAAAVAFGLAMILFVPPLYALMGFVIGALMAVVYNFVSRWMGGIVMEIVPADATATETIPQPPYPLVPGETNV